MPLFGTSRRVARRTARRTSRRQMAMYGGGGDGYDDGYDDGGYDEPAPAPAAAAQPDYTDELAQLAKLHEQGVLTDEEFAAKKKEILGI